MPTLLDLSRVALIQVKQAIFRQFKLGLSFEQALVRRRRQAKGKKA